MNLKEELENLKPWRKGPFQLGKIYLDAEWRCDLKWNRLLPNLPNLNGMTVLDVGCNNGYFMFRMQEHGPKSVLGIDPTEKFFRQFQLLKHYFPSENISFEKIGWQEIPRLEKTFDVIFCMGILYHHREAQDVLKVMKKALNSEGVMILETLILAGPGDDILMPKKHYAGMRNVFAIPTIGTLNNWLRQAGLTSVKILSIDKTSSAEQRVTEWSGPVSLSNFLDPNDPEKTIEGYPAPLRAAFLVE